MSNESKKTEETPSTGIAETSGFRFNRVGGDEPAEQVLVPKVDPAVRRRTIVVAGIAVIAIILLILLIANPFGIHRTGGSGGPGREFQPPRDEPR